MQPIIEAAIEKLSFPQEGPLRITDLGCATGTNTVSHVDFFVKTLTNLCRNGLHHSNGEASMLEFQAFFLIYPPMTSTGSSSCWTILHILLLGSLDPFTMFCFQDRAFMFASLSWRFIGFQRSALPELNYLIRFLSKLRSLSQVTI